MAKLRLRPVRESDLPVLAANLSPGADPFGFFGFHAANELHRRFQTDGFVTDDRGKLAVETTDGTLVGEVSWFAVRHGPSAACRAVNLGISLLAEHRGRGYGTEAQRMFADYLFATTLVERIEAATDVDNVAEQKSLAKAGFTREGVLRHAQFRDGRWRDLVMFSRLRGDGAAPRGAETTG